ncbi:MULTISPECIES: YraN family protein [unclassified Moraxella]|uniref:YraN family protein n=1 Tax=unclassified Moraxella TaxID=2685852 RepID=UPI003AF84489
MKLTAPKQRQGDHYENLARLYLEANGLTFFAKNWHYKNIGELDLIMLDENAKTPCLIIVEVRQRKTIDYGSSLDSITTAKQRKILKATQAFLQTHPQFDNHEIRFDVVSFDHDNPTTATGEPIPSWLQGAFDGS